MRPNHVDQKKKSCELRGLPILSLNFGFVSGDFYGFITILEPTHCWGNTVVLWVVFSKHQNRSKSKVSDWFFSPEIALTKRNLQLQPCPNSHGPKRDVLQICFGLQICRVITKKIVERTLAVMDQGKKLCSLDHEIFIDTLSLVYHCFFVWIFKKLIHTRIP